MLKIETIVEPKEEPRVLIFCRLDKEKDLEILSFIISSICASHFCIEYSPNEILEILEEITKGKRILRKSLIFGIERNQKGIAFLFGQ
jgi:hypothetical protein